MSYPTYQPAPQPGQQVPMQNYDPPPQMTYTPPPVAQYPGVQQGPYYMNNSYPTVYAPAPQQGEYQGYPPTAPGPYIAPQQPAPAPSQPAPPEKKKKKQQQQGDNNCWDAMCCCCDFWLTD